MGLRFDPGADLQVSAHHARFERRDGVWWVEDLVSRNGTFVDGDRIDVPTPVRAGQRIRFGWEGPEVEVVAARVPATPDDDLLGLTRRNRALVGLLAAVVVILGLLAVSSNRSRAAAARAWEDERAALQARTDSVLSANRDVVARLEGEVDGLGEALDASRARVEALQGQLDDLSRSGRPDPGQLAQLRTQIDAAAAVVSGQEQAAALDAATLVARIRPAVVMLYVEFASGRRSVATGFAVTSDGGIVTNRHVVAGPEGRDRAVRIGVQFSGSPQVWPAELVRTDPDADLALLDLRNLVGANPVVPEIGTDLGDGPPEGAPVLLVGFPNAGPAPPDGPLPRALATAGVVLGTRDGRLEIDGWGAAGASGSPVIDGRGRVVGVLYGGTGGADDRRLVAVPGRVLRAFLDGN